MTIFSNGFHQKCEIAKDVKYFTKGVLRLDEKAEWLKGYLIEVQEGDVTNPICTSPEIDARYNMADHFSISYDWAYELIRRFVKRYPQFQLKKITAECGDGKGGLKKYRDWELTWIEKD